MKKQRSIVTQTVMRVSGVFITAIILLTIVFTIFIGRYMRDNILRSKEEQLVTVADTLDSRLNSLEEPFVTLAGYTPAVRLLRGHYKLYSAEWMQAIRSVDTFLTNINLFSDYITDVLFIQPDSTVVYSMNDILRSGYDYVNADWFQEAFANKTFVRYASPHGREHMYENKGPYRTVTAFFPVYQSDLLIGYILMECDLSKLTDFFSAQQMSDSGFLILDEDNRMILDYKNDRSWSDQVEEEFLDSLKEGDCGATQNDQSVYIAKKLSNRWTMVSENSLGIIIQPIVQLLTVAALLMAVVLIFLVLISAYNSHLIKRPFNALIQRIISYDGSRSTDISGFEHAPQELAVIRSRFEEMADHMNDLINDVYVAKLKQKEAEMEALTNQINPHFLYNVFQLIQAKAVLSDNLEIEEMIQALSRMMRYTMERKRESVSLKEELEYTDDYLMFYKKRFTQMFTYEISCDPELYGCRTCKFVLQPVVENCFKHALKNRTGGVIAIRVWKEEKDILILVRDNGCGMGKEALEALRCRLNGQAEAGGIGIINTNSRLRLTYGEEYGITIDSRESEYTEVTLRIPYETV